MAKPMNEIVTTIRESVDPKVSLSQEEQQLKKLFQDLAGWEELQDNIGLFYGKDLRWMFGYNFTPPNATWEPKKSVLFDLVYDLSQERRVSIAEYLKSGLPAGEHTLKLKCAGDKYFIQVPFHLFSSEKSKPEETPKDAAFNNLTLRDLLPHLTKENQNNDTTTIMLEMIRQQREDNATQLQALKDEMSKDRKHYSQSSMGLGDVIEQWETIEDFKTKITPPPVSPEARFGKAPDAPEKKEESEHMQMFRGALEFLGGRMKAQPPTSVPPTTSPIEQLHKSRLQIIGMLGAMEPPQFVLAALSELIQFAQANNILEYLPELVQADGNYEAAFLQMLEHYCHDENYQKQLTDQLKANSNGHRENFSNDSTEIGTAV